MTVVATAGHVDHGKSTLVEALTGTDPDRWAEEKRRGLTIDLGFAHAVLPSGRTVSIVDVPGHSRFLRNMLAGVGAVDTCLFVVDVVEGWRAQSEEHLRIVDLLGIGGGVIALTKADLVDSPTIERARQRLIGHVTGTVLAGADVVPVSAHSGQGLDELRSALDRQLDVADAAGATSAGDRPRLWVDRSFAVAGAGTIVTGTSAGGRFSEGDRVVVEPGGQAARIRSIEIHGRRTASADPHERVALNVAGVSVDGIGRGAAVVAPRRWHLSDCVDATLTVLAALDHHVTRRGAYVAYVGSGEHPVRLRILGDRPLEPGTSGYIRLRLATAIPLVPGDRYVLRESGRDETVGGGQVLDIAPMLPASKAAPDRRWQRVVAERGWVDVDELERLTGERVTATVDRWVVDQTALAATADEIRRRVGRSGDAGVPVAELDERQRALLATLDDVRLDGDMVRPAAAPDPLADHPVIAQVRAGGLSPPDPLADRGVLRQLRQRGLLVERDGVWFHPDALDDAASIAARLLSVAADGFTVAEFRQAAGTSRKYALPLLGELDARGITRRRDQVRIAGARFGDAAFGEGGP